MIKGFANTDRLVSELPTEHLYISRFGIQGSGVQEYLYLHYQKTREEAEHAVQLWLEAHAEYECLAHTAATDGQFLLSDYFPSSYFLSEYHQTPSVLIHYRFPQSSDDLTAKKGMRKDKH